MSLEYKLLGTGAFGTVYSYRNPITLKTKAAKIIPLLDFPLDQAEYTEHLWAKADDENFIIFIPKDDPSDIFSFDFNDIECDNKIFGLWSSALSEYGALRLVCNYLEDPRSNIIPKLGNCSFYNYGLPKMDKKRFVLGEDDEFIIEDQRLVLHISMTGYEGETLQDKIFGFNEPLSGLTKYEFYKIIYQFAQGLEFLHELGIIHKDIKPANVLIEDGTDDLKIIDYGFCKYLNPNNPTTKDVFPHAQDFSSLLTRKESLELAGGTYGYISPEQLFKEQFTKVDFQKGIDPYQFATFFARLLIGKSPYGLNEFSNDNDNSVKKYTIELYNKVSRGHPHFLTEECSSSLGSKMIKEGWQKNLLGLTNDDPKRRSQHIGKMKEYAYIAMEEEKREKPITDVLNKIGVK
jgi:serine/threonine protein kinase